MAGPIEVEVKIAVRSAAEARSLLRNARFVRTGARALEQNIVLDDARGSVRARGLLLRLRTTGRRDAGHRPLVTFKGPARETRTHHKQRVEREFTAGNAEECLAVFAGLGLEPSFRYEKYRSSYSRRRDQGKGLIVLDETPMGVFLEVEGTARWIDATARELGFSRADYITTSYARLWEKWRAANKKAPFDMVF